MGASPLIGCGGRKMVRLLVLVLGKAKLKYDCCGEVGIDRSIGLVAGDESE